jgi:DNA-binding response OmpR family regulator
MRADDPRRAGSAFLFYIAITRTTMPQATDSTYNMLIVEDDPDVLTGLEEYFRMKGYEVTSAEDGQKAIEKMEPDTYDIVLLDVMLPKKNGFEVLEESQENGFDAPILMLTARGEQENILKGFGLGAQDYIKKPFNAEELAARVRAILTRTLPPDETPMEIYEIGDVRINFSTHEATRNGEHVDFTALEFDILRYLIQNRGRTVTRKQLLKDVWGIEEDIITRTIDRHMASVRKKVEPDPSAPKYIETVYGIGYRFED